MRPLHGKVAVVAGATRGTGHRLHARRGRRDGLLGGYFRRETAGILDRGGPADAHERFELLMRYYQVHLDPARLAETAGITAALEGG